MTLPPNYNTYLVPLVNTPQTFGITLAGITYNMTCKWNNSDQAGWTLDIADASDNPLACGLPLITGADVLDGLDYLGIDGQLIVYTNGDASAVPTFTNLGTDSNLYFLSSAANNG